MEKPLQKKGGKKGMLGRRYIYLKRCDFRRVRAVMTLDSRPVA